MLPARTSLEHEMKTLLVGLTLIALLGACTRRELIVESNTSWTGFIGGEESGYSRDGSGNAKFELDDGRTCWTFQKDTEQGSLRAFARTRELFGNERYGDAWTTTAYGVVTGCVE